MTGESGKDIGRLSTRRLHFAMKGGMLLGLLAVLIMGCGGQEAEAPPASRIAEAGVKEAGAAVVDEKEPAGAIQKAEWRAAKKQYGLAMAGLNELLKTKDAVELHQKAISLKAKIRQDAMASFMQDCKEPNVLVRQFRFAEATPKLQKLRMQYDGTQWGIFSAIRLQSVQAQAELHNTVIRRVKLAVNLNAAPTLPFEMESFPRTKFRMVNADEKQLSLKGEARRRSRRGRSVQWTELTPKQVYKIYRVYMPNPMEDDHAALGYFCQERDLMDEADKHFDAADL